MLIWNTHTYAGPGITQSCTACGMRGLKSQMVENWICVTATPPVVGISVADVPRPEPFAWLADHQEQPAPKPPADPPQASPDDIWAAIQAASRR